MSWKKSEEKKDCKIQVHTTEDVRDKLLILAHKEQRSLSNLCERTIIQNLIEKE